MATKTIRLVPSAYYNYGSYLTISNIDNAYTNTDSDTYASIRNNTTGTVYFGIGGFDFSLIPTIAVIDSVKYKISVKATTTESANLRLVSNYASSSTSGKSSYVTFGNTTKQTKEFTANVDFDTIRSYGSDFGINGSVYVSKGFDLYGAEIEVTYHINYNQIIYGNETLIDLTGDTATASDVLSGKTFHLASGLQATGTYVPSANKKTAVSSSSTATSLAFTGLTKEPSFFVALPNSSIDGKTFTGARAICFLYDGETTYKIYGSYSSGASNAKFSASSASFTYSSGTLTVKSSSSVYILQGGWNLFYM